MAAGVFAAATGCTRTGGAEDLPGTAERSAAPMTDGRVILVTGSTDGLGREVALRAARTGAHVIIHGRNEERGREVVREIEEEGAGSAAFYSADFGSFEEVRGLAEAIRRDYERLDVLVNNAGIWIGGPSSTDRLVSDDGHELHFQVNYLSHFLLTELLKPLLVESAPSRIVNVASAAQTPLEFDDLDLERGYTGSRAYGQSKLAQILMTVDLANELEDDGVMVTTLHPATLMDTNLVREAGIQVRSTVDEGAEAVMHLVTGDDLISGQYYNGLRPVEANAQAYDSAARDELRRLSLEFTGLD